MRIGLMRERVEVWNTTSKLNEYGVTSEVKELLMVAPAAIKFEKVELVGALNKGFNTTIKVTMRTNRYFTRPNETMYFMWDGYEWDIVMPDNYYSRSKYISLIAVKRSK